MPSSLADRAPGQGVWESPSAGCAQQEDALLSGRGSFGTGAWPWSTPSGVVLSGQPVFRPRRLPGWLPTAFVKLGSLLRLAPDWDSYGALAISGGTIRKTLDFLMHAIPEHVSQPAIVPTPAGGIQLEWHEGGIDIEIELLPDAILCVAEAGGGEVEFEVRQQMDFRRLRSLFYRLD
jgi:hypothetical protein